MNSEQDWTPVILRRRTERKAECVEEGKKRVHPESIQALIRKRIELGMTQESADRICSFSTHTIKNIESHRALPTPSQQSVLQRQFGIQVKMMHI